MIRDDILDLMAEDRQTSEKQYMVMIAKKIKKYCKDRQNCDGCPFYGKTKICCLSEGYAPINWIINDDKPIPFKVGDEVRIKGSDPVMDDCDFGVVTYINERYMHVMRKDGSGADETDFDNWEKTGRYYEEADRLLFKLKFRTAYRGGFTHAKPIYTDTDSVKEDPDESK